MLLTIVLVVLILFLLGAVPAWPHSRDWGYNPAGLLVLVLLVFLILWALGYLGHPAWAAEGTVVDTQPVVTGFMEALTGVLMAVATVAIGLVTAWIKRYTGQKEAESLQKSLAAAAERAVGFGLSKAKEALGDAPKIDLKNETLAQGAQYIMLTMPDTLKKLGMDRDAIQRRLEAELGKLVDTPAVATGEAPTAKTS